MKEVYILLTSPLPTGVDDIDFADLTIRGRRIRGVYLSEEAANKDKEWLEGMCDDMKCEIECHRVRGS